MSQLIISLRSARNGTPLNQSQEAADLLAKVCIQVCPVCDEKHKTSRIRTERYESLHGNLTCIASLGTLVNQMFVIAVLHVLVGIKVHIPRQQVSKERFELPAVSEFPLDRWLRVVELVLLREAFCLLQLAELTELELGCRWGPGAPLVAISGAMVRAGICIVLHAFLRLCTMTMRLCGQSTHP